MTPSSEGETFVLPSSQICSTEEPGTFYISLGLGIFGGSLGGGHFPLDVAVLDQVLEPPNCEHCMRIK